MFQGAYFEAGHVVLLRQVDKSKIVNGNYPTKLAWVWVTEKTETGGRGLGYGLAVGTLKDRPYEFTNKEVQASTGPHDGKANLSYDLRGSAKAYELSLEKKAA